MSNTSGLFDRTLGWDPIIFKGALAASVVAIAAHKFIVSSTSKEEKSKKRSCEHAIASRNKGTVLDAFSYIALILFSHFVCYYLWWAAEFNQGLIGNPFPLPPEVISKATPNTQSVAMYATIIIVQLLFSAFLPGPVVSGFKIPEEGGRQLKYLCNGLAGWYVSIALAFTAHWSGLWDMKMLFQNSGAMLTTAILFSDILSVIIYLECVRSGRSDGTLRSFPYDFVMGNYLNPRIAHVDLKMWAEIRVSWLLLFALDVSCALCLRDELGYVPNRMWVVLLVHGLYTNACMKGEVSIPYSWDIFHECWGFMLIYWNLAGVAFAYTFQGRFIYARGELLPNLPTWAFVLLITGVLMAYYVFDESNGQKARFRAQQIGAYVHRPWAFPQLPNATLKNPKYMTTSSGSTLLMDGWWKYVRKPHYTADICLSILISIPCGFKHALAYFFVCFFVPMLIHRERRDSRRCAEKYGEDWDDYCRQVPYILIPGIY